eukprot:2095616-Pyramimonas_sp.AAC.1
MPSDSDVLTSEQGQRCHARAQPLAHRTWPQPADALAARARVRRKSAIFSDSTEMAMHLELPLWNSCFKGSVAVFGGFVTLTSGGSGTAGPLNFGILNHRPPNHPNPTRRP